MSERTPLPRWTKFVATTTLLGAVGCGGLFGKAGSDTSLSQCGGMDKAPTGTVVDITPKNFRHFGEQLRNAAHLAARRNGGYLPIGSAANGVHGDVGELETSDVLCIENGTVVINKIGRQIIDRIKQESIAFTPEPDFPDNPRYFIDVQLR